MVESWNYVLAENKESTVIETMSQHILLTFYLRHINKAPYGFCLAFLQMYSLISGVTWMWNYFYIKLFKNILVENIPLSVLCIIN